MLTSKVINDQNLVFNVRLESLRVRQELEKPFNSYTLKSLVVNTNINTYYKFKKNIYFYDLRLKFQAPSLTNQNNKKKMDKFMKSIVKQI